jgi:hypothetical protein
LVLALSVCSFTEKVPDARRVGVADVAAMVIPVGPWMRMMAL